MNRYFNDVLTRSAVTWGIVTCVLTTPDILFLWDCSALKRNNRYLVLVYLLVFRNSLILQQRYGCVILFCLFAYLAICGEV